MPGWPMSENLITPLRSAFLSALAFENQFAARENCRFWNWKEPRRRNYECRNFFAKSTSNVSAFVGLTPG
jgi:hypothetical protein